MKISRTQETVSGRTILTFRLMEHEANPKLEISTDEYPSGEAIRKVVLEWAESYGGGEL